MLRKIRGNGPRFENREHKIKLWEGEKPSLSIFRFWVRLRRIRVACSDHC